MSARARRNEAPTGMTPRRRECLDFIEGFIRDHRYSPSLSEIGAAVHMTTGTVWRVVQDLRRGGYLRTSFNEYRSINLVATEQPRPRRLFHADGETWELVWLPGDPAPPPTGATS